MRSKLHIVIITVLLLISFVTPYATATQSPEIAEDVLRSTYTVSDEITEGVDFVEINNGHPDFYIWQVNPDKIEPVIYLSTFDDLGRTGPGYAVLGPETIPTAPRGQIGSIQPTGWHTVRYDDLIDGNYLYNRCHVIGYQLCGDNATPENLFTGTRHLNAAVMIHFEDRVAAHIAETGNHVVYRVTPIYVYDDDLVPFGVQIEAYSIEDSGKLQLNVFCFNEQPGVIINYETGESELDPNYVAPSLSFDAKNTQGSDIARDTPTASPTPTPKPTPSPTPKPTPTPTPAPIVTAVPVRSGTNYILNTNTHKFHYTWCSSVGQMKASNRRDYTGSRDEVIAMGYVPCKKCNP